MEEKRNNVRVWTLRVLLLVTSLAAFLHRPLPEGFTEGHDRLVMHVVEPVLRLSYLYPTQYFCDDAACRLWWTRGALATLSAIFGPWTMSSPVMNIETTTFDGVKVRVYTPKEKAVDDGAVFFIHGGGFVIGDIDMYEALTREIATRTKRVVVSVDYRLAPEVIFPGGLEDCERAFDHFLTVAAESYGVDPSKVVVMGDSAGGNLVAAMTQRRGRSNKTTSALGQVLIYPLLQFSDLRTPSYLRHHHENMDGFALVDPTSVAMYYMWYAGIDVLENEEWPLAAVRNEHACDEGVVDHEVLDTMTGPRELRSDCNSTRLHDEAANAIASFISNPDFAPLTQKNLTGLPQALVVTMEFDVLRDEGVVYAQRLKEAGVPTKWAHYENGFHAILNFLHFPQDVWLASRILDDILEWTDETIRNASSSR